MTIENGNVFSLLAKPLQEAVRERGFDSPSEPQRKAIPIILEGKNVLLIAPTATGKTEAAILPILNNLLLESERKAGVKVLYITPLRALNRDLLDRISWWCKRLDFQVAVRHGDTSVSERASQARRPPDVLITTPETLQAILPGRIMRRHLESIRFVVIDEVHELACDKRGSQLSLGLERLRYFAGKDFQVVGLSATIGSPEKVAKFLVGTNRNSELVKISIVRDVKLQVLYVKPSKNDYLTASRIYTHPEVAARLRIMKKLIESHRSVILFTNTRSIAEVLASRFKVWDVDFPISIHHGSLSKASRIWAETRLKEGQLKGVVSTSSLELGIDVGTIDLVIQYNSPRQVTRLVQRVGRSGHRIGRVPEGVIIAIDSDDALESMVIARKVSAEELEPALIPEKPYDALSHQIAGLLTQRRKWYFTEVNELFRQAYPYRELSEDELSKVLEYMHGRYPRLAWMSLEDKVFLRPQRLKSLYEYYFGNLSMIPDEKQYLVVDQSSDSAVGILDEAFMAEHGKPGVKFIVRGSVWRINDVYGDKVYVKPLNDPTGAVPSWIGEEIPVPFDVALEVGSIRRYVEEKLGSMRPEVEVAQFLSEKYFAPKETVLEAIKEIVEQVEEGCPIPSDRRITVEEWRDYAIIQCCFGSLVNKTLARVLGHILSEEFGQVVGVQEDPYRIIIRREKTVTSEKIVEILKSLVSINVEKIAVDALIKTGIFKRKLIHVARKFGAISKWADFSEFTLKQLVKSFEGTTIYDEAVRDCAETEMDLKGLLKALEMVGKNEIAIILVEAKKKVSPIARIGIEKLSWKTDLIPSEKMRGILVESAKARLMNEAGVLACIGCWQYVETCRIKNLPKKLVCPNCGSKNLGLLKESEDTVKKIFYKRKKQLKGREANIYEEALDSAELISEYGYPAAVALMGHGLKAHDVEEILKKDSKLDDEFYEVIIDFERQALKRKFD